MSRSDVSNITHVEARKPGLNVDLRIEEVGHDAILKHEKRMDQIFLMKNSGKVHTRNLFGKKI